MSDHWTHGMISMFSVSSACTTLLAHRVYEELLVKTWQRTHPDLVWVSGYYNLVVLNLARGFGIQMGPKSCATWRVLSHLYASCNARFPLLSRVRSCSFDPSREGRSAGSFPEQRLVVITQRHVTQRAHPLLGRSVARRDKNGCVDLRKRPDFQCLLRTFTWKHGTARILA